MLVNRLLGGKPLGERFHALEMPEILWAKRGKVGADMLHALSITRELVIARRTAKPGAYIDEALYPAPVFLAPVSTGGFGGHSRPALCSKHLAALGLQVAGTNVAAGRFLSIRRGIAMTSTKRPSARGFASMDPEKQRAIARKGGESVPNEKRSFSQNPDLAATAGRKGGHSVNPTKRSFSQDHMLAAEAGRKGGHASHGAIRKY